MKKMGKLLAFILVLAMLAAPAMIAANAEEKYLLYAGVQGNGTVVVTPAPEGSYPVSFEAGTPISVTVTPGANSRFVRWQVDGVTLTSNANPATFTMPANTVTLLAIMEGSGPEYIYSSWFGRYTQWLRTPLNGFFYIVLFGWIWMPFIAPRSAR